MLQYTNPWPNQKIGTIKEKEYGKIGTNANKWSGTNMKVNMNQKQRKENIKKHKGYKKGQT